MIYATIIPYQNIYKVYLKDLKRNTMYIFI